MASPRAPIDAAAQRWARAVAGAARLLALSIGAWLLLSLLALPVGWLTGDWTLRTSPLWAQLLATEPGLIAYLVAQLAWWRLCAPGPRFSETFRRITRISTPLVALKIVAIALLTPASAAIGAMGEDAFALLTAVAAVSLGVVVLGLAAQGAQLLCGLWYLRDLSAALGDAELAQRARRVLWGTFSLFAIVVAGLAIGAGVSIVRLELGLAIGGLSFLVATGVWVWMFGVFLMRIARLVRREAAHVSG